MKLYELKIGDTFKVSPKSKLCYRIESIQGLANAYHCVSTTRVVTRGGFRDAFRHKLFMPTDEVIKVT